MRFVEDGLLYNTENSIRICEYHEPGVNFAIYRTPSGKFIKHTYGDLWQQGRSATPAEAMNHYFIAEDYSARDTTKGSVYLSFADAFTGNTVTDA